jgi:hypothetical protein
VTAFDAKVTPGHPCGTIHVQAKVNWASKSKTFTASAVAQFGGTVGDVTIQLKRSGKSFVAGGRIPVPAGQAAGPVTVKITIVYGGVAQPVITRTSIIKAP